MRRAATIAALGLALMAAKSDPLAGRVAGPPSECIEISRVNGPDIIDQSTILYRQSGSRIWKTEPMGGCPGLAPDRILIVEPTAGRLCHGDRFRTVTHNGSIPGPICRLGRFVPYDRIVG